MTFKKLRWGEKQANKQTDKKGREETETEGERTRTRMRTRTRKTKTRERTFDTQSTYVCIYKTAYPTNLPNLTYLPTHPLAAAGCTFH